MKHQKREETYRKKVEMNIKCMIATAREVDKHFFDECGVPQSVVKL